MAESSSCFIDDKHGSTLKDLDDGGGDCGIENNMMTDVMCTESNTPRNDQEGTQDIERVNDCGRIVREILLDYIDSSSTVTNSQDHVGFETVLINEMKNEQKVDDNALSTWTTDMGEAIEECIKWSAGSSTADAQQTESDCNLREDLRQWSKTKITWNEDVCAHRSRERLYEQQKLSSSLGGEQNSTESKKDYGECDFCGESLAYPLHFDHVWETESESDHEHHPQQQKNHNGLPPNTDSEEEEDSGLTTVGPIKNAKGSPLSLTKVVNFGKLIEVQEIELDENCSKCSEKRRGEKFETLKGFAQKTKKGFQKASHTLPRRMPGMSSSMSASPSNIRAAVVRSGRSLLNVTSHIFNRNQQKAQKCGANCECPLCSSENSSNPQESIVENPSLTQLEQSVSRANNPIGPIQEDMKKTRGFFKLGLWK